MYTNKGTLFALYSQEQVIINKASSTISLISSDIAIKNLDTKNITFGDVEFINPPATETVVGVARFANEQEIDEGTDDSLAVSAKRLKQAIVKHEQSRNHPDATFHQKALFNSVMPPIARLKSSQRRLRLLRLHMTWLTENQPGLLCLYR